MKSLRIGDRCRIQLESYEVYRDVPTPNHGCGISRVYPETVFIVENVSISEVSLRFAAVKDGPSIWSQRHKVVRLSGPVPAKCPEKRQVEMVASVRRWHHDREVFELLVHADGHSVGYQTDRSLDEIVKKCREEYDLEPRINI